MDQKEFIIQLLEAIKVPEVMQQLTDITRQQENMQPFQEDIMVHQNNQIMERKDLQLKQQEDEIDSLHKEVQSWCTKGVLLQDRIELTETFNRKLQSENDELMEQLQTTNKQLGDYNCLFYELNKMYGQYLTLSDVCRNELRGIFKETSPDAWIAAGIQPDNIDSLWEYTRMQIMKRQYDDLDGLSQFIYYFIGLYNKTKTGSFYSLQKVMIGDSFDVDCHIRTSESKAAGKIKKVFLCGYSNANSNAIIKKTVVSL